MNDLLIKNAKVITATGKDYDKADILIKNGKISAIDLNIEADANIIDAANLVVTPGLIEAHSHIGVWGEPGTRGGSADGNETAENPVTSNVRAIDGFYIHDLGIKSARDAGFTTCCTLPGSGNIVGGEGFAYKLAPKETVDQMAIEGTRVMKFALGENPRFNYGQKGRSPKTRMGIGAIFRQTLLSAQAYAKEKESSKPPKPDLKLEALIPVIKGEMQCRIHCHRADDIATAIRVAKEFNLWFSLEHATEGFKMVETLKEADVFCVVGPLAMGPSKQEVWDCNFATPGILDKAGINVCLTQDTGVMTKLLPAMAGIAVAHGMDHSSAIKALTINPAKLLGIADQTGSLEVGKDADIAIFDGDPLSNFSHCLYTIIDGKVMER